jgi:uncharacterized SAM-binding protein YcdF (DUF218 family)
VKVSRKLKLTGLAGLLLIFTAMCLALAFPHQFLCTDSGPVKADAIVVLGGGSDRPARAAELFHQMSAPRVIVSGGGDCEVYREMLVAAGVPTNAIIVECESRTTKENAMLTAKVLKQMGAQRVIIVTSWFHSRRALASFRRFAPGVVCFSRPSYDGYDQRDWARRGTLRFVRLEYVKTLGYFVCYGVWPFAS